MDAERVLELHRQGLSVRVIARELGASRSSVHRVVAAARRPSSLVTAPGEDARNYALAAFRLMHVDEAVEAVWMADLAAEQAAVVAETGARQWHWHIKDELAGIRLRAGLPAHWWESIPGWRAQLESALVGGDDDED
ncbi:helix-turn-helix domain-containing protein [Mycobacterium persicum]|uniref:helix-turn-helix domain-containing protein n=1 Tax=Mycobacterium persicum TaxID=1487726 RepID=UPI000A0B1448|nr:helix-turn-helix domain-containing protein [Mycobacterium persicum]ORC02203.1 hypothetical protein B1T48_13970 [Mycobacterium persicum]